MLTNKASLIMMNRTIVIRLLPMVSDLVPTMDDDRP